SFFAVCLLLATQVDVPEHENGGPLWSLSPIPISLIDNSSGGGGNVADAALEKSVAKTHRRSSLNTGSQAKAQHGTARRGN
ncbi:hypothetical protein TYRP_009617, partial [Tyrophagus putrescentiae]